MKQTVLKTSLLSLIFIGYALQVSAQQSNESMKWVQLSQEFIKYEIPIYDLKVNTKTISASDQFIGAIFGMAQKRVFLDTRSWKYNFTDNVNGGEKFKLSKIKPDSEGFRHPDFTQLGNVPFYLMGYEKNALLKNIQALIEDGDYYYLTKQNTNAIKCYRTKANSGDSRAMFLLAKMLDKGDELQQKEAFNWFNQLYNLGFKKVNSYLATYYIEGKIVNKDLSKAETLLLFAEKDDVRAEYLLSNLRDRKDDPNWNPRHEGMIIPSILRLAKLNWMSSYGYDQECLDSQRSMSSLMQTNDADIVNQNLRFIYTTAKWGGGELYKFPNLNFYSGYTNNNKSDISSYWNACSKLLKSGDCDWMWVYLSHGGEPYRDTDKYDGIQIYSIPTIVWDALDVSKNSSNEQKLSKLLEKLCDIAIKTSDIELYKQLYHLIIGSYNCGKWEYGYWMSGDKITWLEMEPNEEVIKKIVSVIKRGAILGIDECEKYYLRILSL